MTLFGLGDSLMQENGPSTFPQEGWVQELFPFLAEGTVVRNFAKNGLSTKSFFDEGFFSRILPLVHSGDVALVSFGHNDEKKEDPSRYAPAETDYAANLLKIGQSLLKKGCLPIFLSSVSRLHFDEKGSLLRTHGDYPLAMEKVAKKLGVPFVPLEELTHARFVKNKVEAIGCFMIFGPEQYPNYPEGSRDRSHLSVFGAKALAEVVVTELQKNPLLQSFLKKKEATLWR
jgi:Lysophospholipase L1 and related esterases